MPQSIFLLLDVFQNDGGIFLANNSREEPKKVGQIFSTSFTLAKYFAQVFPKSLIFAM